MRIFTWTQSVTIALLVALAPIAPTVRAASPSPVLFAALDRGHAVLPRILVTALTVTPHGTIYAGGIYDKRNPAAVANRPLILLGSAWLVSHDHGATWTQNVSTSDAHAFPKVGVAPWRDHRSLPIDFTPAGITVDPHNPRVIYVAGCTDSQERCATPLGGPMVVVSRDGGHSWQTSLSLATIIQSASLRSAYRFGSALPTQGFTVVIDPRNNKRLYAAVSGLGVLRSTDAGRTWVYLPQPQTNQTLRPCELLFDPRNPSILYELDRAGALYRTSDAGTHWTTRSAVNTVVGGTSASLTFVGPRLYVTAARGLYASNDGGLHWHLRYAAPPGGTLEQSVRGADGWVSTFDPLNAGGMAGLYLRRDGHGWQLAADTHLRGPKPWGSLDFQAMSGDLVTRLWEDHLARIVFTAGPLGGLYRWRSRI